MQEHSSRTVDTSLLENKKYVDFIAAQPPGTVVYFPEKAAELAGQMQELVQEIADPSRLTFDPFVAVKALHQPQTLKAIFQAGFRPDIATAAEAKLSMWASGGLVTPQDMGFSNTWAGEAEIRALVQMGVRHFVVDKKSQLDWIADEGMKLWKNKWGLRNIHVTFRILVDSKGWGDKFGMPMEALPEMARYAKELGLFVDGVAFHVGTDNSLKKTKEDDLFQNYAKAIRKVAHLCNKLYREGLVGNRINTEGGYRPAYAAPEYLWEDIMASQVQAFMDSFQYPVVWQVEPGRFFGPAGVGIIRVNNVDEVVRTGKYRYVGLDASVYLGLHDYQWEIPYMVRERDVRAGKIYTHQSNPDEFQPYVVVGLACAGSDQMGHREGVEYVLLPRDLEPGEILWLLPCGAYTSSAMGPQAFQEMEGIYRGPEKGFNGLGWLDVVSRSLGFSVHNH